MYHSNMQNLYAYRNERSFHKRTCDKCGKSVVSIFPQDSVYKAYCNDCWWHDQFDPLASGRDFDFQKPFFEQFDELLKATPLVSLVIGDSQNSDYTNYAMWNKNCYMVSSSDYNQDCFYSSYIFRCRDSADCIFTSDCELSYGCVDTKKSYGSVFVQNCSSVNNSLFCYACRNCENCIGCVNLRGQKNHIFNKPATFEEVDKLRKWLFDSRINIRRFFDDFQKFKIKFPHKAAEMESCDNCTGDRLVRCKNLDNCFDMVESEDCQNCILGIGAKDCTNSIGVPDAELCHQVVGCPGNYGIRNSVLIWPKSSYLEYCLFTRASHNCFGCVSLHKNEFCILNKQYTKEEYSVMVDKIKDHMIKTGESDQFFPIAISPFAYNETAAQDYYHLSRDEALAQGYKWRDNYSAQIVAPGMPECATCGKSFKITSQEKALYGKIGLSSPDQCCDCRHNLLMSMRNPRHVWNRRCGNCGYDVESSFSEDMSEIVYCEKCYLKVVSRGLT